MNLFHYRNLREAYTIQQKADKIQQRSKSKFKLYTDEDGQPILGPVVKNGKVIGVQSAHSSLGMFSMAKPYDLANADVSDAGYGVQAYGAGFYTATDTRVINGYKFGSLNHGTYFDFGKEVLDSETIAKKIGEYFESGKEGSEQVELFKKQRPIFKVDRLLEYMRKLPFTENVAASEREINEIVIDFLTSYIDSNFWLPYFLFYENLSEIADDVFYKKEPDRQLEWLKRNRSWVFCRVNFLAFYYYALDNLNSGDAWELERNELSDLYNSNARMMIQAYDNYSEMCGYLGSRNANAATVEDKMAWQLNSLGKRIFDELFKRVSHLLTNDSLDDYNKRLAFACIILYPARDSYINAVNRVAPSLVEEKCKETVSNPRKLEFVVSQFAKIKDILGKDYYYDLKRLENDYTWAYKTHGRVVTKKLLALSKFIDERYMDEFKKAKERLSGKHTPYDGFTYIYFSRILVEPGDVLHWNKVLITPEDAKKMVSNAEVEPVRDGDDDNYIYIDLNEATSYCNPVIKNMINGQGDCYKFLQEIFKAAVAKLRSIQSSSCNELVDQFSDKKMQPFYDVIDPNSNSEGLTGQEIYEALIDYMKVMYGGEVNAAGFAAKALVDCGINAVQHHCGSRFQVYKTDASTIPTRLKDNFIILNKDVMEPVGILTATSYERGDDYMHVEYKARPVSEKILKRGISMWRASLTDIFNNVVRSLNVRPELIRKIMSRTLRGGAKMDRSMEDIFNFRGIGRSSKFQEDEYVPEGGKKNRDALFFITLDAYISVIKKLSKELFGKDISQAKLAKLVLICKSLESLWVFKEQYLFESRNSNMNAPKNGRVLTEYRFKL